MTYFRTLLASLVVAMVLGPIGLAAQEYRLQRGDVLRIEVIEDEALNRTVLIGPDGRINFPQAGTLRAAGRSVTSVQSALAARLRSSFNAPPTVFVALEQLAPEKEPIEVEPETISIYVLGEVSTPGKVDMEPGATVLQAFAQMGGFSNFAATKRVQLRRTDPKTGTETVISLNYEAITLGQTKNATLKLRDGDVILVPTRKLFE